MSANGAGDRLATTGNGRALARSAVPELSPPEFSEVVAAAIAAGLRVASFFGTAGPGSDDVGLFVVLELLSNNVMEPLLYGHSVGLSSLAVIVAAIFWTWLWGAIGLVIATPMTACLVVLSRYVPALGAIGQLLGQRPALRPHETLYQRLLARDANEAGAIVTRCRDEHSIDEALQLVLDTLLALKRDLQAGRVSADEGAIVIGGLNELLEAMASADMVTDKQVLLMGAPGRDPLDAVVLELARLTLRDEPLRLEVLSTDLMSGEVLAAVEQKAPAAVIVPSM